MVEQKERMSVLFKSFDDIQFKACGIDEAGKGCLFGPVCSAAVILPDNFTEMCQENKIILRDSKKMTEKQKQASRKFIEKHALDYSVQFVSNEIIDKDGISVATILSMNNCIENLKQRPFKLLIDGNFFINKHNIPYECIIKGDNIYPEIKAASILAKTYRDEYILNFCSEKDEWKEKYDLHHNKGYGTKNHIDGIQKFGLTSYHRKSFCKKFT